MAKNHRTPGPSEQPPQRNALAPGLLAALVCIVSTFVVGGAWSTISQFVIAILALVCAWFAVEARQFWWLLLYLPIAVLWNPVLPFGFTGTFWAVAHVVAAVGFIVAGLRIHTERKS